MEASRIMNLYQFIQLYKDITSQASGVLAQSSTTEDPDGNSSSVTSCQASLWMGRYTVHKYYVSLIFQYTSY